MAPVFDTGTEWLIHTEGDTKAHTVTPSGSGRAILVDVSVNHGVPAEVTMTYGGQSMTQLVSIDRGTFSNILFYLLDPPTGTNNCIISHTSFGVAVISSFTGMNTASEAEAFGTVQDNGGESGASPYGPFSYSSEDDELVLDAYWYNSGSSGGGGGAGTPTEAGQVEVGVATVGSASIWRGVAMGYKDGASSVSQGWTYDNGGGLRGIQVSLKPRENLATRPVEYFIDAFDPQQRIVDSLGHIVPRWKVKSDTWIRVAGLNPPTSIFHRALDEDPSVAYIESVKYDAETDSIEIITNRGELPEVILASVASGSIG